MSSIVKTFNSKKLYPAVGPYSTATYVKGDSFTAVHTSGVIALDKNNGQIISSSASEQANLALTYLIQLITELGGSVESIAKVNLFITDMDDFASINAVYAELFKTHFPSRACVQVSRLPKDAKFEVEAVAYIENDKFKADN